MSSLSSKIIKFFSFIIWFYTKKSRVDISTINFDKKKHTSDYKKKYNFKISEILLRMRICYEMKNFLKKEGSGYVRVKDIF